MTHDSKPQIAPDGWVSVRLDDGVTTVHVRVGAPEVEDIGGGYTLRRPVVTAIMIEGPEVTTDTLRQIQPARVLAAIDPNEWRAPASSDDATTMGGLRARTPGIVRGGGREPLGRPDGSTGGKFYERFAAAYRSASADTSKPAVLLAEENDVPVETVRRWIKEARRRGHLAPGRKGRAG